jgi:hypothetical protein
VERLHAGEFVLQRAREPTVRSLMTHIAHARIAPMLEFRRTDENVATGGRYSQHPKLEAGISTKATQLTPLGTVMQERVRRLEAKDDANPDQPWIRAHFLGITPKSAPNRLRNVGCIQPHPAFQKSIADSGTIE